MTTPSTYSGLISQAKASSITGSPAQGSSQQFLPDALVPGGGNRWLQNTSGNQGQYYTRSWANNQPCIHIPGKKVTTAQYTLGITLTPPFTIGIVYASYLNGNLGDLQIIGATPASGSGWQIGNNSGLGLRLASVQQAPGDNSGGTVAANSLRYQATIQPFPVSLMVTVDPTQTPSTRVLLNGFDITKDITNAESRAISNLILGGGALGSVLDVFEVDIWQGSGNGLNLAAMRDMHNNYYCPTYWSPTTVGTYFGNTQLGSSTAAVNTSQIVIPPTSATPTYTLIFNGQTATFNWNDSNSVVQTGLNALSSIGGVGGSVTVTAGTGAAPMLIVAFGGNLSGAIGGPQPIMTSTGATVLLRTVGAFASVSFGASGATTTEGVVYLGPANNQINQGQTGFSPWTFPNQTSPVSITLADDLGTGIFTPSSFTLGGTNPQSANFSYQPQSAGGRIITPTIVSGGPGLTPVPTYYGSTGSVGGNLKGISDAGVIWSPYTWQTNTTVNKQSINWGSYFRTLFGGTSFTLNIDMSAADSANQPQGDYPFVVYRINGNAWTTKQIQRGNSTVSLATGLAAGQLNLVECFVSCCGFYSAFNLALNNYWNAPSSWPWGAMRITGFTIDAGFSLVNPGTRSGGNLLWYGPSQDAGWSALSNGNPSVTQGAPLITITGGTPASNYVGWVVVNSAGVPQSIQFSGTTNFTNNSGLQVNVTGVGSGSGFAPGTPVLSGGTTGTITSIPISVVGSGYATGLATTNDASVAAPIITAFGLNCELGAVNFGGIGWTIGGNGGVPAIPSSYDKYWNGASRLVGGLFSPMPTHIILDFGTNDGNFPHTETIQTAIYSTLSSMRTNCGGIGSATNIWVVSPFIPDTWNTGYAKEQSLYGFAQLMTQQGVAQWLLDNPTDVNTRFLGVPMNAPQGQNGHYNQVEHAKYASELIKGINAALAPTGGGGQNAFAFS